jgi:hypothetical protein
MSYPYRCSLKSQFSNKSRISTPAMRS